MNQVKQKIPSRRHPRAALYALAAMWLSACGGGEPAATGQVSAGGGQIGVVPAPAASSPASAPAPAPAASAPAPAPAASAPAPAPAIR